MINNGLIMVYVLHVGVAQVKLEKLPIKYSRNKHRTYCYLLGI